MRKSILTFLCAGFLYAGVKAQTIQEGMGHLYADRFKSAIAVFDKLLATNPNNIEAIYWLGQVYFDLDDNAKARQIYETALASNGNAPLIMVGLGHSDLLDNKISDARQKFEAALTASRGRKGDDPNVLTAIGRANVDAKAGDPAYAVQKLLGADQKNTETLLQLGNAYRKANPGQGGGQAYETYVKALQINPSFAVANHRLAKLFESQKNWEFVLQYLNAAVKTDPKFTPAYYDLFYYYWFNKQDYPEAENQLNKYIESKTPETDIQDQFMYAQLCWGKKDYNCAVQKAESVAMALGNKTKPKVYKLLADANFQKGDYTNAKKYIDLYFTREKKEDIISFDYKLKADILSKTGGTSEEVLNTYLSGVEYDTVLTSKIDFLKRGLAFFKENKMRDKEAILIEKIITLKPKPTINDFFDLTLAYYFSGNFNRSREEARKIIDKYPDQIYGYEWAYNSAFKVDSLKKDSLPFSDALKLYEFSQKDTTKFKRQYISSIQFLASYYVNVAKDKDKSIEFFTKWLEADTANAAMIQGYIDTIKKMSTGPANKPATTNPPKDNAPAKTGNSKGTGEVKPGGLKTTLQQ